MAYALRYYKELIHEDGSVHRLEIHKKDSTASAIEIGAVLQALSLEIQGSQGDVDSPIVKTSLHMTFVDAGDVENGQKNGFWEEFYTPDSLLWKVILMAKTATETSFRTIWGGYVTPDSFSESLVYRGSVSITARDNIGHMQDFPFDAVGDTDGLISLRNLVESGWEKIASPMSLVWNEAQMMYCEGVSAYDTLMNASLFKEKDWYKAIESALASYGMVMRYIGDNVVQISSLRYMPYQGKDSMDDLPQIEPIFIAGAQRELIPAARRIEESVDYQIENPLQPLVQPEDFDGTFIEYDYANVWPLSNTEEGNGWRNPASLTPLYFNPSAYDMVDYPGQPVFSREDRNRLPSSMMLLCDTLNPINYPEHAEAVYSRILSSPFAYTINFGITCGIEGSYATSFFKDYYNAINIHYSIAMKRNGITEYLQEDGTWGVSAAILESEVQSNSVTIPVTLPYEGNTLVELFIARIGTDRPASSAYGTYVVIEAITVEHHGSALREKNTVNTVYNAANNVILSRDPEIGPAFDNVALPCIIKNGIFYRNGDVVLPARTWGWSGGTPQQMAVYNHLQLLCYFAKPNNYITGTIVNADLTRGSAIYLWHGKEHLLVSGMCNFLNGQIESAALREFTRYDDMWADVSDASLPDTEQESTTDVESGASSGGSSSTYTNTTTVNIGGGGGGATYLNDLLDVNTDAVIAQSILYFNGTEWVSRSISVLLSDYVTKGDLASMWYFDSDGNLVTDKQVKVNANLIVTGDTATGGTGEDTPSTGGGIDEDELAEYLTDNNYVNSVATLASLLGYTPVNPSSLATVATSGSYTDLDNKPTSMKSPYALTINSSAGTAQVSYDGSATKSLTLTKSMVGLGNVANSTYAGGTAVTLNGTSKASSTASFYAPTSAGTSGQLLVSSGGAPSWVSKSSISLSAFTDDVVAGKYLPLSGGTLTGSLYLGTNSIYMTYNNKDMSVYAQYIGSPVFCYGTADEGYDTYMDGYQIRLRYGMSHTNGLILNSSGNVGIGTASPSYKLDVAGSVHAANGLKVSAIGIECDANGNSSGYGSEINRFGANLYLQTREGNLYLSHSAGTTYVRGASSFTGAVTMSSTLAVSGVVSVGVKQEAYNTSRAQLSVTSSTTEPAMLWLGSNSTKKWSIESRGSADSYRFSIYSWESAKHMFYITHDGNTYNQGNLIVSGDTATGSDIRFKDIIEDRTIDIRAMADAPLFTFTWNDRSDDKVHLGTSAQYWERVAPWLVKGEDFKHLDYSTLGVAMAVSLAKKTVDIEDRVKVLEKENEALKAEIRRIQNGAIC